KQFIPLGKEVFGSETICASLGTYDCVGVTLEGQKASNRPVEGHRPLVAEIVAQHKCSLIVGEDRVGGRNLATDKSDRLVHVGNVLVCARDVRTMRRSEEVGDYDHDQGCNGSVSNALAGDFGN